jgi:hypothetical protein
VNQDPLGQQGLRLENASSAPTQRWVRTLANGDVAVGLHNRGAPPVVPPIPAPPCPVWNHSTSGYWEACGGNGGDGYVGSFSGLTPAQAQDACCRNMKCAGVSAPRRPPRSPAPFAPLPRPPTLTRSSPAPSPFLDPLSSPTSRTAPGRAEATTRAT